MTSSSIERLTEQQWHHQAADDAATCLSTDLGTGLSRAEVPKRQERYGFND